MLYISNVGNKAHQPHGIFRILLIVSDKSATETILKKEKKEKKKCFGHNGPRKDPGVKTMSLILNLALSISQMVRHLLHHRPRSFTFYSTGTGGLISHE